MAKELGTSSSATGDVERATTPLITQITKINLSYKEIKEVQNRFNDVIDTITVDNKPAKLEEFKAVLTDGKIEKMEAYYKQEEKNLQNVMAHLPDQKSFLNRFSLQEILLRMLKDIAKYAEFLKLFIKRFKAHKERIEGKLLQKNDNEMNKSKEQHGSKSNNDPRMMRELDAPLHCAVRQLNKGFIEWLLKEPETEVNLRNKRRETALAILCQMYDWSKEHMSELKTRLEEIEKEREKADKMQQMWLDDEQIKLSALKKELIMNASTILNLIESLLKNGADFNIYMNEGALPFDFLRKYDTEADVGEIINSYVESSVAMTEKSPKRLNAEGKNLSKKRIVKFYKKTEDMDVRVTVELLEIFIRFNDSEKFTHYGKDFEVTGDNVKKVITLLLHVAVERNYTSYVDHIIKKASKDIFELKQNKATDTQDPTRLVAPVRNHIRWCCLTERPKTKYSSLADSNGEPTQNETIEPKDNIPDSHGNRAETTPKSDKQPSRWCCFKRCQKRRCPDSQTQNEEFELRTITSNSQDQCELLSERPRAGSSKGISMNAGGSYKKNPSATEDAEPQPQHGTSKIQVTDPYMKSATSKPAGTVSQTQCEVIESQDNNADSQNNHGTPSSDGTNPRTQRQNSKDCRLAKAEANKMVHRNELKGLLKMVCLNGNKALLTMFLEKMNDRLLVNQNPLLINTLNGAYTMKQKKESIYLLECIKILINNHRKVDMYRMDMNGNTALHLALSYGYENLALLMLKHGHGLLGIMNNQYLTPIEYGRRQFWDNYLDNCITVQYRTELKFNLNFLQPPAKNLSIESTTKVSCGDWLSCLPRFKSMDELHNSKYRFTRTVNDMTALCLISQSKDRKELLMHPVIIAFIIMKWERLCHWNILNLLLTTFTMGTFIGYTQMSCPSVGWKYLLIACVILGAFIISVREFMQVYLLRWSYVTVENVVDILNVVFIVIVLFCGCERDGWCEYVPIFSSFVVISLSLHATFLLGASWNNLSITLYMFKTVSSSFFYSFLSFTPVIGAFIYSFYRTNNEPSDNSATYYSNEDSQNKSSEKNFNNFPSFLNASIKTLVMTTGEFEAANIDFDGGKWLLFVAFVFIAPIVILNLINGLAVSDIAAIRQESEFISICRKVKLIERYERAVINYGHTISGLLQQFFRDPWFPGSFFQEHESIIYLNTRELNQLKIQKKKGMSSEKPRPYLIPGFFVRLFKCMKNRYFGFRSYEKSLFATLDQSYVDKAMAIVSKRFTISTDETTSPSTADT